MKVREKRSTNFVLMSLCGLLWRLPCLKPGENGKLSLGLRNNGNVCKSEMERDKTIWQNCFEFERMMRLKCFSMNT